MAGQAQSVMTHHVREVVRNGKAQAAGRLPGNRVLQLNMVLRLSDPAGLKSFLADVYNPASANNRHFLTPQEFTARFGPTQAQYDDVVRSGLSIFSGCAKLGEVGPGRVGWLATFASGPTENPRQWTTLH